MKWLRNTFLKGLFLMAPLVVTAYVLYWIGAGAEGLLGGQLRRTIPEEAYIPGMGIAAAIIGIFLFGLLMHFWMLRVIFELGEKLLQKIPVVKTVYGCMQDLMAFFSRPKKGHPEQVVMVTVGDTGLRLMGIVTREDFSELPQGIGTAESVAVYLPMSYQIGGFTTMVPRSAVTRVDMRMNEAMRFAMTAGMSTKSAEDEKKKALASASEE